MKRSAKPRNILISLRSGYVRDIGVIYSIIFDRNKGILLNMTIIENCSVTRW